MAEIQFGSDTLRAAFKEASSEPLFLVVCNGSGASATIDLSSVVHSKLSNSVYLRKGAKDSFAGDASNEFSYKLVMTRRATETLAAANTFSELRVVDRIDYPTRESLVRFVDSNFQLGPLQMGNCAFDPA